MWERNVNPSRGIASRRRKIRSFGYPFRESGTVKHHAFWMRLFDRDPIMSFNFSPRAIICNLTAFLSLRLGFAPAPSTNSQNISPRNTSRIAFHFRCDPNLHPAHIRHVQSGQPFKARGNGHTHCRQKFLDARCWGRLEWPCSITALAYHISFALATLAVSIYSVASTHANRGVHHCEMAAAFDYLIFIDFIVSTISNVCFGKGFSLWRGFVDF